MHIRAIRGSFRRRVWHPCHTHAALRIPSTEPIPSLFAQVLPRNSRNSQKFLAEDILPQIAQIFTEVGGYGIPAIPTPPSEFLPQNHSKFVCASPPTEFTEFTEVSGGGYSPTDFTEYTEASGGEEPPTDFTDAHRWLGYVGFSHEIHRIHRSFWRRRASHGFHRCTQIFLLRQSFLCVP